MVTSGSLDTLVAAVIGNPSPSKVLEILKNASQDFDTNELSQELKTIYTAAQSLDKEEIENLFHVLKEQYFQDQELHPAAIAAISSQNEEVEQNIYQYFIENRENKVLKEVIPLFIEYVHLLSKEPSKQERYLKKFLLINNFACVEGCYSDLVEAVKEVRGQNFINKAFSVILQDAANENRRFVGPNYERHLNPFFRYCFGFYTEDELKKIDIYASKLIKMIPTVKIWEIVGGFYRGNLKTKLLDNATHEAIEISSIFAKIQNQKDFGNDEIVKALKEIGDYKQVFPDLGNVELINEDEEGLRSWNQEEIEGCLRVAYKIDQDTAPVRDSFLLDLTSTELPMQVSDAIVGYNQAEQEMAILALWTLSQPFTGNLPEQFIKAVYEIANRGAVLGNVDESDVAAKEVQDEEVRSKINAATLRLRTFRDRSTILDFRIKEIESNLISIEDSDIQASIRGRSVKNSNGLALEPSLFPEQALGELIEEMVDDYNAVEGFVVHPYRDSSLAHIIVASNTNFTNIVSQSPTDMHAVMANKISKAAGRMVAFAASIGDVDFISSVKKGLLGDNVILAEEALLADDNGLVNVSLFLIASLDVDLLTNMLNRQIISADLLVRPFGIIRERSLLVDGSTSREGRTETTTLLNQLVMENDEANACKLVDLLARNGLLLKALSNQQIKFLPRNLKITFDVLEMALIMGHSNLLNILVKENKECAVKILGNISGELPKLKKEFLAVVSSLNNNTLKELSLAPYSSFIDFLITNDSQDILKKMITGIFINLNYRNLESKSLIVLAIEAGAEKSLRYLVGAGADVNSGVMQGFYREFDNGRGGYGKHARRLGSSLEYVEVCEKLPLKYAEESQNLNLVRILLESDELILTCGTSDLVIKARASEELAKKLFDGVEFSGVGKKELILATRLVLLDSKIGLDVLLQTSLEGVGSSFFKELKEVIERSKDSVISKKDSSKELAGNITVTQFSNRINGVLAKHNPLKRVAEEDGAVDRPPAKSPRQVSASPSAPPSQGWETP